jgi:serine/threonine protein phosphatase PrpC
MRLESFGVTDVGSVRSENQDRIIVDPVFGLYAVCDGMGGHRHGGLAAEIAVSAMRHFLEVSQERLDVTWPFGYDFALSADANRLMTSVKLANRMVWRQAEEAVEHAGMGTTVAAVMADLEQVIVANVGDSRVYRIRDGSITQLSIDDTMVANLAQQGLLTLEEISTHPMRNILTQAAGAQEAVTVHLIEEAPLPSDCYLICCDGLYGVMPDQSILERVAVDGDLEQCVNTLVQDAIRGGSTDNVSAVVLRYS